MSTQIRLANRTDSLYASWESPPFNPLESLSVRMIGHRFQIIRAGCPFDWRCPYKKQTRATLAAAPAQPAGAAAASITPVPPRQRGLVRPCPTAGRWREWGAAGVGSVFARCSDGRLFSGGRAADDRPAGPPRSGGGSECQTQNSRGRAPQGPAPHQRSFIGGSQGPQTAPEAGRWGDFEPEKRLGREPGAPNGPRSGKEGRLQTPSGPPCRGSTARRRAPPHSSTICGVGSLERFAELLAGLTTGRRRTSSLYFCSTNSNKKETDSIQSPLNEIQLEISLPDVLSRASRTMSSVLGLKS